MKITRSQLKQLIKEELLKEACEGGGGSDVPDEVCNLATSDEKAMLSAGSLEWRYTEEEGVSSWFLVALADGDSYPHGPIFSERYDGLWQRDTS
jgi:hypothetical protein